jgi:DNA processing protein
MTGGETDPETRIAWLRLTGAPSVGPATFAHLLRRFGSASRALEALPELARRGGRPTAPPIPSREEAEQQMARAAALGARLLLACEAAFPPLLAAADGAPPLLWILGEAALLSRPCVAVVGARSASAAGRRFARELAAALGEAGLVVVSGLARGIDAAAHAGALESGTAAVLAGGVDQPYPAENAELYRQIARRGCVVSERAIGHVARAADFPRRNRIISGLALGSVIVEAELRSGSLITARLAAEQGREVFAVPGSPYEPRARGANDLIRQGATLVESAKDVLDALHGLPGLPRPRPAGPPASGMDESGPAPPDDLGALGEALDALLSPAPVSLDELARASGAPVSWVTAALVELSLAGRAELAPGGYAHRA